MAAEIPQTPPPPEHTGWNILPPEKLPAPTYWPAALALGITCLVWGLITSLMVTAIGAVLFAMALFGWIQDIRHERNKR